MSYPDTEPEVCVPSKFELVLTIDDGPSIKSYTFKDTFSLISLKPSEIV